MGSKLNCFEPIVMNKWKNMKQKKKSKLFQAELKRRIAHLRIKEVTTLYDEFRDFHPIWLEKPKRKKIVIKKKHIKKEAL